MRTVLMLSVFMLSGCAGLLGDDSTSKNDNLETSSTAPGTCPTAAEKIAAYNGGENFMEKTMDSGSVPFTLNMVGTVEGEIDDMLIKFDPASKGIQFRTSESTFSMKGPYVSFEDDVDSGYYRDFNPEIFADMSGWSEDDEDDRVSFLDDLTVDDYQATCKTLGGVEVIEYTYNGNGVEEVMVVERSSPHRPLSGRIVDPALQDNYRISISHETPAIQVKDSLPRVPLMLMLDIEAEEFNSRGGIYIEAVVADGSQWAPFSEIQFHIIDTDGFVTFEDNLADSAWQFDDGDYFQYDDLDGNNMLSTGDFVVMDTGPDFRIDFFDLWADEYLY